MKRMKNNTLKRMWIDRAESLCLQKKLTQHCKWTYFNLKKLKYNEFVWFGK